MKPGDLVKPKDKFINEYMGQEHRSNQTVGLIMEWDVDAPFADSFLGASGWVMWMGNCDWAIVYEEDLELVSNAAG